MASIFDIGDYILDTITGGKRTTDKSAEAIENAGKQYETEMQNIANNQKSAKELYQAGKEAAAGVANNKAGLANKNAKAAAMQQSGSKLLSAIQGAEAANTATQEGFDTTANQAAGLEAGQQNIKTQTVAQGAANRYNSALASAQMKADQAQKRAANGQAAAANMVSSFIKE